jgi:hypothetical protein
MNQALGQHRIHRGVGSQAKDPESVRISLYDIEGVDPD